MNTENKTITLPLSEYLDLIDEQKNKNYYEITGDLCKSITQARSKLMEIYSEEIIWNTIFKALKDNNLNLHNDGGLSRIK